MKDRTKGLLIVGGILILGVGVYFTLTTINQRKKEDEELEREIEELNRQKREDEKSRDKFGITLERWFGWKKKEKA